MTIYESTTMERRRHPRTQLNISAQCIRLDPDGVNVTDRIDVVDVSRGGMGALSTRPFYPGQRVILSMPSQQGNRARNIHAAVVRCRHRTEGYHIGLEFDPKAISTWADSELEYAAA